MTEVGDTIAKEAEDEDEDMWRNLEVSREKRNVEERANIQRLRANSIQFKALEDISHAAEMEVIRLRKVQEDAAEEDRRNEIVKEMRLTNYEFQFSFNG